MKLDQKTAQTGPEQPTVLLRVRYLIAALMVTGVLACLMGRQNLSIAIVAMIKNNKISSNSSSSMQTFGPSFEWTPSARSLILESFFWPYTLLQVPTARAAEIFGAKRVLLAATLGSGLINLALPWLASVHYVAFACGRGLLGVLQASIFPACYVLAALWLSPQERARFLPFLTTAAYLGSTFTSLQAGLFSRHELFGWPYGFYLPGAICLLWSIIWITFGASEPAQSRLVSQGELAYIRAKNYGLAMAVVPPPTRRISEAASSSEKVPEKRLLVEITTKRQPSWIKLAKTPAVWALATGFFATHWALHIVLLLVPSYLNYVLQVPILKNGLINSIISLSFCISSPLVGLLAAWLVEMNPSRSLAVRKLFQLSSMLSLATSFLVLTSIGPNTRWVAFVMLYSQMVLYSLKSGGETLIPAEMSIEFVGTLYALCNCIGSSTGFLVPRIHSWIVTDLNDSNQWNHFFYMSAGIILTCSLIFATFARNNPHDFANQYQQPVSGQLQTSVRAK